MASRHGPHQVPQKSSSTSRPRWLRNSHVLPFRSARAKFSSLLPLRTHEGTAVCTGGGTAAGISAGRELGPLIFTRGDSCPLATVPAMFSRLEADGEGAVALGAGLLFRVVGGPSSTRGDGF